MRTSTRWLTAAALVFGLSGLAAIAQPPRQPGGFGFGFGFGGPTQLVNSKTVQAELKVTDEQAGKLKEWSKEYGAKQRERMQKMFAELKDLPREEVGKKMAEMQAETTKEVYKELGTILKDEQVSRLKQIEVQVAGTRAFLRKDVQDAMKFTDEQKEKLRDIQQTAGKEMQELAQEYGFGGRPGGGAPGTRPDPEKMKEFQKKSSAINKETMSKITAMLTEEQKKAWQDLTGAAVDVAKIQEESRPQFGPRPKKDD